jgi:hypothetical protein
VSMHSSVSSPRGDHCCAGEICGGLAHTQIIQPTRTYQNHAVSSDKEHVNVPPVHLVHLVSHNPNRFTYQNPDSLLVVAVDHRRSRPLNVLILPPGRQRGSCARHTPEKDCRISFHPAVPQNRVDIVCCVDVESIASSHGEHQ